MGKGVEKGIAGGAKGIWGSIEQNWKWYVVGALGLGIVYLIFSSGSSSSGTTTTAATGGGSGTSSNGTSATSDIGSNTAAVDIAKLQYRGQATLAQIGLDEAQVAASASAASAQSANDSQDYITTVQSGAQANTQLAAIMADQNTGMAQVLGNAFGSFISGTSSEVSAVAGSTASTASANDSAGAANLQAIGNLLPGLGILTGALNGSGKATVGSVANSGLSLNVPAGTSGLSIGVPVGGLSNLVVA